MTRWLRATLTLFLLTSAPAMAQDTPDEPSAAELQRAKQLYTNGRELFADELYREAVDAWREGYRLSRKPAFLHNMGLAYEEMGFLEEAVDALNRYRAYARAEESDELKARIANIESRIASIDAGDGDPGKDGLDRPKPGIEMLDEDFDLDRGDTNLDDGKPAKPKGDGLPKAPLAILGGGGGAVLVGLVVGNSALSSKRRAGSSCGDATGSTVCLSDAQSDLSKGRALSVVADVLVIGGLAAAGTGAYLAFGPQKNTLVSVGPSKVAVTCAF